MIGIYKITSPEGKIYIGQSINIKQRFNYYKRCSCKGQTRLYNSFKKHGIENHIFTVEYECDMSKLNEKERFYQEVYNVISLKYGLNCMYVKSDSKTGVMSDESKQRMSDCRLGDKNYMFGRAHSKEAREKISKTHKGTVLTEEHKRKLSENAARPWLGKNRSDQTKQKLREYRTGRRMSEDQKQRISKTLMGRIFSEEHKKKIGEANRRRVITYETRKKWMRPVIDMATGFVFDSIMEAAKCFHVSKKAMWYRIKNNTKTTLIYL